MSKYPSLQAGLLTLTALVASGAAAAPTAKQIIDRVLDVTPWGSSGCELTARAVCSNTRGSKRELRFSVRALRYAPGLSKSIVRFSRPADISGASFLQIQKRDGDDERHLFLPALKRSRRVAGDMRSSAFMGTDFVYADLDQRDLRDGKAQLIGDAKLGKHACWKLKVAPASKRGPYARIELWVRKDNYVPLKLVMFNKAGVLLKTNKTREIRRVKGRWFITKMTMTSHQQRSRTDLVIETINTQTRVSGDEFTVRNLEKL